MFVHNLEKMRAIFDKVYVSTEDEEIGQIARDHGAEIIWRDKSLCGDTPDIDVYQAAFKQRYGGRGFVAVHADTPLVSMELICLAHNLINEGEDEVCTVHPFDYSDDYHSQSAMIYGSIRGMSMRRLYEYEDPYRPRPRVLLVDPSPEIETREDYDRIRCSMFQ